MSDAPQPPTRLERLVDVLAKGVIGLWVGGLALVLVNSFALHQHWLSIVGVAALQTGLLFVFIIVASVMSSGARRKNRRSKGSGDSA